MFTISAIQTLSFVLVGNWILGIQDMHLFYWLMLFSAACFANTLGLNISATFNSAKVIYIIIPVLIIPQLLFSGVIVKFDKLHPAISSQSGVPFIGNIMASRWAYEALAVVQFTKNNYEREFYEFEKRKKFANWKKDYWAQDLKNRVLTSERLLKSKSTSPELGHNLNILRNEIASENDFLNGMRFQDIDQLHEKAVTAGVLDKASKYIDQLIQHYRRVYNKAADEKEQKLMELTHKKEMRDAFQILQDNYSNESLESFVTNKNDLTFIIEFNDRLIQKKDLIYRDPFQKNFFDTHFYAPSKSIGGVRMHTYWANLIVLWCMSLMMILLLFVNGLSRGLKYTSRQFARLSPPKPKRTTSPSVL